MQDHKSNRIVWLVRGLMGTGLLMVAVGLGLIGWTLSDMRAQRAQSTEQQRQLNDASDLLGQLITDARAQIQSTLDETATPPRASNSVGSLSRFIQSQLNDHPDAALVRPLTDLDQQAKGLLVLAAQCSVWRNGYNLVLDDNNSQRTITSVRGLITRLRDDVDAWQGQRRLADAILYRQWKRASGDQAQQLSRQILADQARDQSQGTNDFQSQLSELARLVELLNGTEQFDGLADLKDNQLKPVLDRLDQSAGAFASDSAGSAPVTRQSIEDLNVALFGKGYVIDQAHQSIQVAPGGLFTLRWDTLQLRRQRDQLRRQVSDLFENIEESRASFGQLAQVRAEALAQELEHSLVDGWSRMWIWGGFCLVVFLWLSILLSRGIYAQVDNIEEARSEAETERQKTQRLMSEQQAAARELDKVNKQLLDTSRQAGMAEVATGVLHNVGNVLTSVNVSANVIRDKVAQSRVSNLAKASDMIQAHRGDLAAFLTADQKGRQLPGYFSILAKELAEENATIASELGNLARGIEHIKQVVQLQQDMATSSTFCQFADPSILMEDALRINLVSLERHKIEIVREMQEMGELQLDTHKVLQVLINLISNAKNALKRTESSGDRRIVLRLKAVERESRRFVRFEVSDTGIGIPPENLSRIFTHGFTTHATGHGFGLHASANVAREMGGTLTVSSKGPGRGATFVLEIPVAPAKARVA
jgi:signal transduction histidine kinase